MQWHYAKQGQQFGPVDESELCRLAREGGISPDDLVWNSSFGDKWAPASSVENLFPDTLPGAAQPDAGYSGGGSTENRVLMERARESLQGRWGIAIGIIVLMQIIMMALSLIIPIAGSFLVMIITGPMTIGLCVAFLSIARRKEVAVGQLFCGFNSFGTGFCAYLLVTIFVMLWTLLFIIPGIIAAYSYAMTFFIIADNPSIRATEAIARSKVIMQGNKCKLFCLFCRFIGWALLCTLTLGIGYLWLAPYMQASIAHFYDDIKG